MPETIKKRLNELGLSESEFIKELGAIGQKREFIMYLLGLNGHEPHTYEEAAAHFSISVERAKQLERAILNPFFRHF